MSTLLSGKTVCITGSSRGIGRACATEVVRHGATGLILHYLGDTATEKEMITLKEEVRQINPVARVVSIPGDISDPETSAKVGLLPQSWIFL
jgi:L-rhamnose 1-dehydrogenase